MEKLTNRQKDVLDYIKSYVAKHGYPPAVREIGTALGLNSPATIQSHINALESKGYIKKTNSKYRSLEIVGTNEYINEDVVEVPLLGKITAGSPIEAIETHGALKGAALAIYRVIRCNPLCKGGYDPVPPRKSKGEN